MKATRADDGSSPDQRAFILFRWRSHNVERASQDDQGTCEVIGVGGGHPWLGEMAPTSTAGPNHTTNLVPNPPLVR